MRGYQELIVSIRLGGMGRKQTKTYSSLGLYEDEWEIVREVMHNRRLSQSAAIGLLIRNGARNLLMDPSPPKTEGTNDERRTEQ